MVARILNLRVFKIYDSSFIFFLELLFSLKHVFNLFENADFEIYG